MFNEEETFELKDLKYFQNRDRDLVLVFKDDVSMTRPKMLATRFYPSDNGSVWVEFSKESE